MHSLAADSQNVFDMFLTAEVALQKKHLGTCPLEPDRYHRKEQGKLCSVGWGGGKSCPWFFCRLITILLLMALCLLWLKSVSIFESEISDTIKLTSLAYLIRC